MASVEDRLSYLEGRVEEQSHGFGELRGLIIELGARLDNSIHPLDQRINRVEQRLDRMDQRIDLLDQKMSRQFFWLAGFQLTTLLAIIGFLGRLTFP